MKILPTLKHLKLSRSETYGEAAVKIKDLKQMVIKWIDELQTTLDDEKEDCLCYGNMHICQMDYEDNSIRSAQELLKHIFNLTKEDLK